MGEIATYYLEQTSPSHLIPKSGPTDLVVREAEIKHCRLNRFFYLWVGEPWQWTDRLAWTDHQWQAYAEDANLHTWLAYVQGTPAGYFELQRQQEGDVEIALFGLAPPFLNRGLGSSLLTEALRSAWAWKGTHRVWVHTCTLDHPHALQNYIDRGMTLYRTETTEA